MHLILFNVVMLTGIVMSHAQQSFVPVPLLSPQLSRVALYGEDADKEIVSVRDQPFQYAIRVKTYKKPPSIWDIALALPTVAPVSRWDAILGTFYARCVGAPNCRAKTEYVFAMAEEPYTPSAKFMVDVGSEWKKYEVPFVVNEDFVSGKAKVRFRLGFDPQTIEIGGIETVDYSTNTDVHSLPKPLVTYPGREVDTAWRQAADERIEKIRKADLKVIVKDKSGNPISGVTVEVRMQKHAFPFGCGLGADQILDPTDYGVEFRDTVKALFNTVALENDLKWPWWERNPKPALAAVKWLNENGFRVRAHCLIWAGWRHMPKDLYALKDDPKELSHRINSHIAEEVARLKGQVFEWDAINEQYSTNVLTNILGMKSALDWLDIAHRTDPKVKLLLNEDDIIEDDGVHTDHQEDFYKKLQFFTEHNAPFDLIGLQGHFTWLLTPPGKILEILDRFAAFKKPIEITEFNIDIPDEKLQADYTRDFMTSAFSHPSVSGIIYWDAMLDPTWKTDTPFFHEDGSMKLNGKVWKNLVLEKWWTNVQGMTDSEGKYSSRGFLGEYKITVRYKDKTKSETIVLPKNNVTTTEIILD